MLQRVLTATCSVPLASGPGGAGSRRRLIYSARTICPRHDGERASALPLLDGRMTWSRARTRYRSRSADAGTPRHGVSRMLGEITLQPRGERFAIAMVGWKVRWQLLGDRRATSDATAYRPEIPAAPMRPQLAYAPVVGSSAAASAWRCARLGACAAAAAPAGAASEATVRSVALRKLRTWVMLTAPRHRWDSNQNT
jgi:hypothetical protein